MVRRGPALALIGEVKNQMMKAVNTGRVKSGINNVVT